MSNPRNYLRKWETQTEFLIDTSGVSKETVDIAIRLLAQNKYPDLTGGRFSSSKPPRLVADTLPLGDARNGKTLVNFSLPEVTILGSASDDRDGIIYFGHVTLHRDQPLDANILWHQLAHTVSAGGHIRNWPSVLSEWDATGGEVTPTDRKIFDCIYNSPPLRESRAPTVLAITTVSLPSGVVGGAYARSLTAVGGATPYTWSIGAGTMPPGLALNASTGLISGTPTSVGTSALTVKVTDSSGLSDTRTLSITIRLGEPSLGIGFGAEQFALIPPGTFKMGSPYGFYFERPVHRVNITKPFNLQKTEVTQAQWRAVMGTSPSHFQSCDNCPVEQVSWDDIQNFLLRLNAMDPGMNYRLPTEAEWEYAARAGTTDDLLLGSVLDEVAWWADNSESRTHPVAEKLSNAWGLYDMPGNAGEWVQDYYSSTYYATSPTDDPRGPDTGYQRVCRSGCFDCGELNLRPANRSWGAPSRRSSYDGFRLAMKP